MRRASRRAAHAALVLALIALASSSASAQGTNALAKEAYDRGTKAHERGEFKKAAEEFAKADALAPSPVALQAALDAAVEADDPVLGAELLERSKRAPAKGALTSSIDAATKKLAGRAGRVKVMCPANAQCFSTIDGVAFDGAKGIWTKSGTHALNIKVDGAADTRTIEVHGAEQLEVVAAANAAGATPPATPAGTAAVATPPPSSPTVAPGDDERPPLSPVVFWVGVGVTVVLGGATTLFAVRAANRHSEFEDAGCGKISTASCPDIKERGENAQRLANVGFAATGLIGVATIVAGAFFTDWKGGSAKTARIRVPLVAPLPGGMGLSYAASF